MFETGRIVIKTAGRSKGKYGVVLKKPTNSFVLVCGPREITGLKTKKYNIRHLKITEYKLDIDPSADDQTIAQAWKNSGLIEKLKIKIPTQRKKKKKSKETRS